MKSRIEKDKFIEKIFSETYDNLQAFIYYKSHDKTLVEDILQDIYIEAYRHADELMQNENYEGWFYATAINKLMKHDIKE